MLDKDRIALSPAKGDGKEKRIKGVKLDLKVYMGMLQVWISKENRVGRFSAVFLSTTHAFSFAHKRRFPQEGP